MEGRGSKGEGNLISLFQRIGMNEEQIKQVFEHIYFYGIEIKIQEQIAYTFLLIKNLYTIMIK